MTRDGLAPAFEQTSRWSAGDGVRAYYGLYAASRGKPRYGDKTPGHARRMGVLAEALPEAHFIHIIRDGRDVAASLRGLPFAPGGGDMAAIAALWRDTIWRARRAAESCRTTPRSGTSGLSREPEAVLRELCDFLELPFDPAMLDAHERATSGSPSCAPSRSRTAWPDSATGPRSPRGRAGRPTRAAWAAGARS